MVTISVLKMLQVGVLWFFFTWFLTGEKIMIRNHQEFCHYLRPRSQVLNPCSMVLDDGSNQQGVSILFEFNPLDSVSSSLAAEILLTPSRVGDALSCELFEGSCWQLSLAFLGASLDRVMCDSDKLPKKVMTRNELKPHLFSLYKSEYLLVFRICTGTLSVYVVLLVWDY